MQIAQIAARQNILVAYKRDRMENYMKKNTLKKILSCLLAATMLASMLVGCGSGEVASTETEVASSYVKDANLSELGVEPICKEKITLTVGLAQNTNVMDYDTNAYTLMLEEALNADIEFHFYTVAEINTQIDLAVNGGGDELPDIILTDLNADTVHKYGEAGMLIPLNDYYENSSYYLAQAAAEVLEADGIDVKKALTSYDGNIYAVPGYTGSYVNPPAASAFWLYRPWLEAVGKEAPTTTDELYEVLKAFKEQDPNGNGKADEIPAMGSNLNTTYGIRLLSYCIDPFVRLSAGCYFLNAEDGQLSVSYTTDEFKEGIKFVKKLVDEGLIDPLTFSQDNAGFSNVLKAEGDQILGSFNHQSDSVVDKSDKNQWVLCPPLAGPSGEAHASLNANQVPASGFITKNCANPEAAFRLLDYMFKQDVMCTARWGIEGENWNMVADLKQEDYPDYNFANTFAGHPATVLEYNSIWGQVQNANWNLQKPSLRTNAFTAGVSAAAIKAGTTTEQQSLTMGKYYEAGPAEAINVQSFIFESASDSADATETANLLSNYVKEKMSLWCTGKADIDADWDAYLKELENMGLTNWLATMQEAYK